MSILASVTNILANSQSIYADIQNVIKTVKEAEADGKITPGEVLEIMEAVLQVIGDITMSALDIKAKIS